MRRAFLISIAVAAWLAVTAVPSSAAAPPLPSSMAAIGDSMTQAFDVCCWYGNHPADSWSTGWASWDGVHSHYERILANKPAISGHNFNDAVAGAQMADAPGQASAAVSQGAKYVTILMGANDICTSSISSMTPVVTFKDEFEETMSRLETGLPRGAHIFVSSIPNVYRLWQVLHDDLTATLVWSAAHICQSMLSPNNTETDRQTVLAREEAFNRVLAQTCGAYANCRFDGDAVFNYLFSGSQVSHLDYFHPNLSGQAALAEVTWGKSWWPAN
jgi:lysophospholipase L1-like esterase